jgi:hypothetical protein
MTRLRMTATGKGLVLAAALAAEFLAAAAPVVATDRHGGSARTAAARPVTVCTSGTDVLSGNVTWSATSASAYLVGCTLEIARGATLTIEKQTVVKFDLGGAGGQIYVAPGGRLSAEGCPQPPHVPGRPWHRVPCPKRRIVFTTVYDDSAGGATAPPGTAGSQSGYGNLVIMDGQASVYIDYADVRHAATTVSAGDPLVIAGCAAGGGDSLVLTDTTLTAPVSLGQCDATSNASHYVVSGDTFRLPSGTTGLSVAGNPADSLTAAADRFDYSGRSPTEAIVTNGVPVQGVGLAGSAASSFAGGGQLAVNLANGSVPAHRSWDAASPGGVAIEGQVAVAGATSVLRGARLDGAQLTVEPGGRLAVAGTAHDPASFENGAWIDLTGSGALAVTHGRFGPSPSAAILEQGCAAAGRESVRIADSTFAAPVQIGSCDSRGGDSFVIADNRFAVPDTRTALALGVPELNFSPPGRPGRLTAAANVFAPMAAKLTQAGPAEVTVYGWPVQGIALTGRSANRFLGRGNGRVLALTAAALPFGASWTVDPRSGAILDPQTEYYFGNPGLAVRGRLVLDPGTVVKIGVGAVRGGGQGVGYGIGLANVGRLFADGTVSHPILFTSMNDSAVGGASYGVHTTAGQKDYEWAVSAAEGSTVQVSHAIFRDGLFAFEMSCGDTPEPGGGFHLTDSLIDDEITLGNCNGAAKHFVPVLQRDRFNFDGAPSGQFAAGGGYDPAALQPALLLYNADPTGIALSGSTTNHFDGKGAGRVVALAGAEIPHGQRWTVSGAGGAVLAAWPDTDYLSRPGITVDGRLALGAGAIVKSAIGGISVDVAKPGALTFPGPESRPVVFTAISDDSVGGDSNGDGSLSHPATGAYGTAVQFEHLSGDMPVSHVVFRYATDGLSYMFMRRSATVSHSDFVLNQAAIEVEETSGPDYAYVGNVPCVPPWLSGVIADRDWFGPGGRPAPDIDLASFVGAVIPAKFPFQGTAFNFSGMSGLIDTEQGDFGKGNTVPWAIYSCPAIKYPFPVTAVEVDDTPRNPNYAPGAKNPRVGGPFVSVGERLYGHRHGLLLAGRWPRSWRGDSRALERQEVVAGHARAEGSEVRR